MKYVALLRGINVGKTKRINMNDLKQMFEQNGCDNVSAYINSGNVIFETAKPAQSLLQEIEADFKTNFGYTIPTLLKTTGDMKRIIKSIPSSWMNDTVERTDVAYLFDEIDSANIIDELPMKKEFIDIRYTKGALFWNIKRVNYNKSRLNKLISHRLYQYMTIRNINTARHLAVL